MTTPTIDIAVPNAPTIDLSNLTQGIATGVGVFDVLMRGVVSQLEILLNKGHINKNELSNMVMQAIPAVLQQSSAYALAKEKQGYEIALLKQQYSLLVQETEVQTKQALLAQSQIDIAEYTLSTKLPVEVASIEANTAIVEYNLATKLPAEVAGIEATTAIAEYTLTTRLPAELTQLTAQTALVNSQKSQADAQTINIGKQGTILDKESTLKDKEIALSQAQKESQEAQTVLYTQKTATEKAQVDPTGVLTGSVIYYQNQVLIKQKEALDHDARLKLVKVYADIWSVRRNADDLTSADHINYLNDHNMGNVIEAAMSPLGITPDATDYSVPTP